MKLGLMPGVPAAQMRDLGFEAVQMFFKSGREGDAGDPTAQSIEAELSPGNLALAAMTLHIDLVGPHGVVEADVDRAVRVVAKTAALSHLRGDNPRPILVWHPSGYPDAAGVDDGAVFGGLCAALGSICAAARKHQIDIAVELSRACSVCSAEGYLRIRDKVASPALRVCLDAANFVPDRTPLERAVRMLGSDVVIAHAKDSRFKENGEVAAYGPTGSGKLDYARYLACLKEYCQVPYLVLEYYQTRDEMLRARDIIRKYL